jgi:phenylacetic acid degradation protein
VKINSDCLIGAATFIPAGVEIPPARLVMGSSARVVKPGTEEQLRQIRVGLELYQDLARRYLTGFREVEG